jgi:transposase
VTSDDSYIRGKKPVASSGVFAKTLLLIWLPLKLACSSEVCHSAEKKSLAASERNEEERANWRKQRSQQEAHRLVFLDECGSNIALTPSYGRAPKGERAQGSVPRNRGKNTTLIASLSLEGIGASMILEGGVNALAFEIYVEQILAPSLHQGQIVVMDNLQVHKATRVRQLIEDRGCHLLFLPAYSPDFSPIEETFSKIKAFLRRTGARTQEALQEAIAHALLTVTPQDARGWFRHCSYLPSQER